MNDLKHPRQQSLADQIAALERSAIAPPVPGELCDWLEEIVQGCVELEPVLRERVERDHARVLSEIRKHDLELSSRVAALEEEGRELLVLQAAAARDAQATLAACRHTGGDETRLADRIEQVKGAIVGLALRIRTQEAALGTWHQEALLRDRGPVD
jgi:hypothetical protein